MNCCKHKYFVIFRGDDTDFPGNQELIVELNTERDLTGCSAHFSFQGFTQDFAEIPSDKKLRLVIPNSATGKFALGAADAKLWLTNGTKVRTVENRIHIVVTNRVDEAYDNDDPQAITVSISSGGSASIDFDEEPTEGSKNAARSGGIWSWVTNLLTGKLDKSDVIKQSDVTDSTPYGKAADAKDMKANLGDKRDLVDLNVYGYYVTEFGEGSTGGVEGFAILANDGYWYFDKLESATFGFLRFKFEDGKCRFENKLDRGGEFSLLGIVDASPNDRKILIPNSGDACVLLRTQSKLAAVATDDTAKPANGDLVKYDAANDRIVKATAGADYIKEHQDISGKLDAVNPSPGQDFHTVLWGDDGRLNVIGGLYATSIESHDVLSLETLRIDASSLPQEQKNWNLIKIQIGQGNFLLLQDALDSKADRATTLAGYGITDGATKESLAPEYSVTSAYSVGAIVYHDGNIYQCKTAIAEGGEAWNAEHWELRKLDDFFTDSNSLLNGRLAYSRNATGLKDRAFNTLSFDGTEFNLSTALEEVTPTAVGQPRDLLIVATATAATTISFTAGTIKGDKPTIDGVGTWLITLTEYAANTWYCRQIKMEDAA